jgi:rsbT antagonist protein RsbS
MDRPVDRGGPEESAEAEPYFSVLKIGACLFACVPPQLRDVHARALQEAIARRLVAEKGVRGLLLDVSALGIVDSYAAKVLEEIGSSARSLGARAILVGLRPAVAITLVELGIDLAHVETAMSLERALRMLQVRIVMEG